MIQFVTSGIGNRDWFSLNSRAKFVVGRCKLIENAWTKGKSGRYTVQT
jgi:hypothetical protein